MDSGIKTISTLLIDKDKSWNGKGISDLKNLVIKDVDVSPVGDVLLKILDQKLKLRNAADSADVILEEGFIPHTFTNGVTLPSIDGITSILGGDGVLEIKAKSNIYALRLVGGESKGSEIYISALNGAQGEVNIRTWDSDSGALRTRVSFMAGYADCDVSFSGSKLRNVKLGTDIDFNSHQLKGLELFEQTTEPTTTDIPDGSLALWHDTSATAHWYLCWNQGGTVRTAELS